MGRQRIPLIDGGLLVLGYDHAFGSWFAMRYDDYDEDAAPRAVVGYHPAEQDLLRRERPDAVIGPWPVEDAEVLLLQHVPKYLGLEPEEEQPPCWLCGEPPWQSNPSCRAHPYDRLRGT